MLYNTSHINSLYKEAARREIKEIQKNNLSDSSIKRIADNNVGQNERLIRHLDSGSLQNADIVNLPGHGIAIRKSQQYQMPLEHYVNHPDYKIVKDLQGYQNSNNTHGGFAKVLKTDDASGLHFHEYIKGDSVRKIKGSIYSGHPLESEMKRVFNHKDPVDNVMHMGDIHPELAKTVDHLKSNGHENIWDYAKSDNIIVDHNNTHIRDARSIDLQGSSRGNSAIEQHLDANPVSRTFKTDPNTYFRNGHNPNWQFKERAGIKPEIKYNTYDHPTKGPIQVPVDTLKGERTLRENAGLRTRKMEKGGPHRNPDTYEYKGEGHIFNKQNEHATRLNNPHPDALVFKSPLHGSLAPRFEYAQGRIPHADQTHKNFGYDSNPAHTIKNQHPGTRAVIGKPSGLPFQSIEHSRVSYNPSIVEAIYETRKPLSFSNMVEHSAKKFHI